MPLDFFLIIFAECQTSVATAWDINDSALFVSSVSLTILFSELMPLRYILLSVNVKNDVEIICSLFLIFMKQSMGLNLASTL